MSEYDVRKAFLGNENRFWKDPCYVDGSEIVPGKENYQNPAEVMIFFIAKNQMFLKDCPEWHINKMWVELDNDGIAELLKTVTRIHIYDIYTGKDAILVNKGS